MLTSLFMVAVHHQFSVYLAKKPEAPDVPAEEMYITGIFVPFVALAIFVFRVAWRV